MIMASLTTAGISLLGLLSLSTKLVSPESTCPDLEVMNGKGMVPLSCTVDKDTDCKDLPDSLKTGESAEPPHDVTLEVVRKPYTDPPYSNDTIMAGSATVRWKGPKTSSSVRKLKGFMINVTRTGTGFPGLCRIVNLQQHTLVDANLEFAFTVFPLIHPCDACQVEVQNLPVAKSKKELVFGIFNPAARNVDTSQVVYPSHWKTPMVLKYNVSQQNILVRVTAPRPDSLAEFKKFKIEVMEKIGTGFRQKHLISQQKATDALEVLQSGPVWQISFFQTPPNEYRIELTPLDSHSMDSALCECYSGIGSAGTDATVTVDANDASDNNAPTRRQSGNDTRQCVASCDTIQTGTFDFRVAAEEEPRKDTTGTDGVAAEDNVSAAKILAGVFLGLAFVTIVWTTVMIIQYRHGPPPEAATPTTDTTKPRPPPLPLSTTVLKPVLKPSLQPATTTQMMGSSKDVLLPGVGPWGSPV